MNHAKIEWAKNPDGTQGYTWNPITGCLNGCSYCYARKLANGRLRTRYLMNTDLALRDGFLPQEATNNPFYPRFWEDRLSQPIHNFSFHHIPGGQRYQDRGIFVCDMSDLFGVGIPSEWTEQVLETIKQCPHDRFYLLTKQPQNLIQFSPFPDNCWVGVTATNWVMLPDALYHLSKIKAAVRYISFEPLLEFIPIDGLNIVKHNINWVIIGAQTKPHKLPKWDWVLEIIMACDRANIPVFLKDNLGLPRLSCEGATPFYKKHPPGTMELRQEMPVCQKPQ